MSPDPISDEELAELRAWRDWPDRDHAIARVAAAFDSVLARLDAQTATIKHFTGWLKEAEARAEAAPHAALASPEGVVTLNGQQWRVDVDGEIPGGHDAWLVPYPDRRRGNVSANVAKIGGGFRAQQVFEHGQCIGMNAWCTASECGWFRTYGDGSASSITDARRRWNDHWRDGECGGER